jgi:hypothetical protein
VPCPVTRGFICPVMQIFSFDILEPVKLNDGIEEQINCYLVKRNMRLAALKSYALSVILCAHETRCFALRKEHGMAMFKNSVLLVIFCPKIGGVIMGLNKVELFAKYYYGTQIWVDEIKAGFLKNWGDYERLRMI